jgi:hypothetical protein
MRNVWLVLGFVGTLAVGLLAGLLLGVFTAGGEQGTVTPSPRTVTVERTVRAPGPTGPSPRASAPAQNVGSLDDARRVFEEAVEGYGSPNLEVAEVMEFANNYYAEVREKDTGIGAMELLIDKPGGQVYPEPGPNMMWNAKYGMMSGVGGYRGMMGPNGGGMMGPGGRGITRPDGPGQTTRPGAPAAEMTVSPEQAREIADAYVGRVSPGTRAGEAERFYGYYTLHTEKDGEVTGMLSVNGYSGEILYHSWHGPFIAMEEED